MRFIIIMCQVGGPHRKYLGNDYRALRALNLAADLNGQVRALQEDEGHVDAGCGRRFRCFIHSCFPHYSWQGMGAGLEGREHSGCLHNVRWLTSSCNIAKATGNNW